MSAMNLERRAKAVPLGTRPDLPEQWLVHESPIPFEKAARLVLDAHEQDSATEDLAVRDLGACRFGAAGGVMQFKPSRASRRGQTARLPLRELAFRQLCERIGAPAGFIRRLPAKLQVASMNWGLAQVRRSALVRLAGNEVRAIVSDRYAVVDDVQLLEVVGEVLRSAGLAAEAMVRATVVGPQTVLRMTVPNHGVAVRPGDVIEYGLDISNSELGLRSVQVTPVTLRLVCTNGMRAWRSEVAMRLRHTGDPRHLRDLLRVAVPSALAEARGDLARWKRAASLHLDSARDEVESLRGFGLSGTDLRAVGLQLVSEEGTRQDSRDDVQAWLRSPTSVFAVANALTAAARERASVPARLALEETAHRYLTSRTASFAGSSA
jgi:hypothetical protein